MANLCACGCGLTTKLNNKFVHGHNSPATDLKGRVFGRLTVISRWKAGKEGRGATWRCRCSCGNYTVVPAASLRTGNTKSCGCGSIAARMGSRENNPNWKGDAGDKENGRERARRWFPEGVCAVDGCTAKAERHHKDENPLNNDPSNIEFLCHTHHMRVHYKGVPKPLEMRRKIAATLKGRKPTPEARAKQAAGLRAWWAQRKAARCA